MPSPFWYPPPRRFDDSPFQRYRRRTDPEAAERAKRLRAEVALRNFHRLVDITLGSVVHRGTRAELRALIEEHRPASVPMRTVLQELLDAETRPLGAP